MKLAVHSRFFFDVLCLSVFVFGISWSASQASDGAERKYVFTADATAVDKSGRRLYVKDEVIESALPAWKPIGKRLGSCGLSMTIPPRLSLVFSPVVIAEHIAKERTMECLFDNHESYFNARGKLTCTVQQDSSLVYFDDDPDEYFGLGPNTAPDEALEVARAVRHGQVAITGDYRRYAATLHVGRVAKFAGRFTVDLSDHRCYSAGRLDVTPEVKNGRKTFVAQYVPPIIE